MSKEEKPQEINLYRGLMTVLLVAFISIFIYGIFVNGWDKVAVDEVYIGNNGEGVTATASAFWVMMTFWVGFLFYMLLFTLAWERWPLPMCVSLDKRIQSVLVFVVSAVAAHLTEWMVTQGHPAKVELINYYWLMADLILFLLIWTLGFGAWPLAKINMDKQPMKGAVISAGLLVIALIIYVIGNEDKTRFADYTGLYIPTLFIMICWYLWYILLMDRWPFADLKQPINGVVTALIPAILTLLTYLAAADWVDKDPPTHMNMANRTWDYITFTGVWLFWILVVVFVWKGWPATIKPSLGEQPIKGIVLLFFTGALAAITQYVWLWTVGGADNLIDVGFGPFADELLLLAVWFYVVLVSLVLYLGIHWEQTV